jgi:hypothetical protein
MSQNQSHLPLSLPIFINQSLFKRLEKQLTVCLIHLGSLNDKKWFIFCFFCGNDIFCIIVYSSDVYIPLGITNLTLYVGSIIIDNKIVFVMVFHLSIKMILSLNVTLTERYGLFIPLTKTQIS